MALLAITILGLAEGAVLAVLLPVMLAFPLALGAGLFNGLVVYPYLRGKPA